MNPMAIVRSQRSGRNGTGNPAAPCGVQARRPGARMARAAGPPLHLRDAEGRDPQGRQNADRGRERSRPVGESAGRAAAHLVRRAGQGDRTAANALARPRQMVEIDVPTGKNDAHAPAAHIDLPGEEDRERHGR